MANDSTLVCTAQAIAAQLRATLSPDHLEVFDESAAHSGHVGANGTGFGTHFRVRIGSPLFQGKTRVAAHRLVYDSLQNFLDAGLHALAIELTPSKITAEPEA